MRMPAPENPATLQGMKRLFLFLLLPVLLFGCTRWGSSSGWERPAVPDEPDFDIQERETAGSYTPLQVGAEDED